MKPESKSNQIVDRRSFIKAAGAATAFTIVPRYVLGGTGYVAPSDTVYIAGIGVGGKGESDLTSCAESKHAKISLLCDVDDRMAVKSRAFFTVSNLLRINEIFLIKV